MNPEILQRGAVETLASGADDLTLSGMRSAMDLRNLSRNADTARRMRACMQRQGVTMRGHRLWTAAEDEIVRQAYPDYKAMLRQLPLRSYRAVRGRASALGLQTKRPPWTAKDRSLVRRMYPINSRSEILAAIPAHSWSQVMKMARRLRVFRPKKPYVPTGHPMLDDLRTAAHTHNINMPDLDTLAGTKRYFQRGKWGKAPTAAKASAKAARVLGGELRVTWTEDSDEPR